MNFSIKLPTLLVLFLSFLSFNSGAQDWTETEIQEMYLEHLASVDIEGWIDGDGDVQFEYEGHSYFLEVNEDDQEFFRVVAFNLWPIESSSESVQAAFACDAVSREIKVAKAYIQNDNVWIACEMFVDQPDDYKGVLDRCLDAVEQGIDTFVENM